jgi:hypothetical protein
MSLLIHNLGTIRGWVVNAMPWLLYTRRESQYLLYRKLGKPRTILDRYINLTPNRVQTPD